MVVTWIGCFPAGTCATGFCPACTVRTSVTACWVWLIWFGNACFQRFLFGGLCERHARCDQGDQQAGRQRCAHGFQRTVAHVALSPKWQGDAARGARSSRDCGAFAHSGYSPLVEPGPAGRSLSTMV
ncbi:hypothetical protein G6F46_014609 [Rhizopus delemar]|nr:hypothetical protein G6F46_014609 [Rhizopus delemar]